MTPAERTAAEARLAELRPKLYPDWEYIDGGQLYRAQRDIAAEIRQLEKSLGLG